MLSDFVPRPSSFATNTHRWLFEMVRQSLIAEGHLSARDPDGLVPEVSRQLQLHWWSFMPVKHLLIEDGRLPEDADEGEVRAAIDEWLRFALALAPARSVVATS